MAKRGTAISGVGAVVWMAAVGKGVGATAGVVEDEDPVELSVATVTDAVLLDRTSPPPPQDTSMKAIASTLADRTGDDTMHALDMGQVVTSLHYRGVSATGKRWRNPRMLKNVGSFRSVLHGLKPSLSVVSTLQNGQSLHTSLSTAMTTARGAFVSGRSQPKVLKWHAGNVLIDSAVRIRHAAKLVFRISDRLGDGAMH